MPLLDRLHYYRRTFSAYFGKGQSQLTFWHDVPTASSNSSGRELGEYYMDFSRKADYPGHHDASGVPMLDYRGRTGLQYNPIAIAQWGLGNHTLFLRGENADRKAKFIAASEWLHAHLEQNSFGIWVWNHHFDWEYRDRLRAPWYSALAQGQAVSLLVRAFHETAEPKYLDSAEQGFESFLRSTTDGGVVFTDENGDLWFEEYLVSPPTHVLNGFIWASWGLHDYYLATGASQARDLFHSAVRTLRNNLSRYDIGFWSLYEQSGTLLPMVASPFYHRLHIVQLRIMHALTSDNIFAEYADRWEHYTKGRTNRTRALLYKSAFKICYY